LWERAIFFEAIWARALEEYDELKGLDWKWQSMDGCITKAPLSYESGGANATNRGKNRTKRSLLVEGHGLPIAIMVSRANTHDVKLLRGTLDNIVIYRPRPTSEKSQGLCLDAAYIGCDGEILRRGYTPHVHPRGEEKQLIQKAHGFRARR
jgi:putative transposase